MPVGEIPLASPTIRLTDIPRISRKPLVRYYRNKFDHIMVKHGAYRYLVDELKDKIDETSVDELAEKWGYMI